jgi:hypothetical protein
MQVLSMLFREMKEYDDQVIRSYNGNASPANLLDLERFTDHGRDFSASALAGVAGRIVRPIADSVSRAAITGGFSQQRMMFTMSCLVRGHSRQQVIHEISGYTDGVGATNSLRGVLIDERMCLYFNSVTKLSRMQTDTSRGNRMLTQIMRSNQVISQQSNPDFTMARGSQGTMTMRPEDLFTRNTTNRLFEQRARQEGSMDLRGGYTMGTMKFSNRLNTSSTRFMSRSLTAIGAADRGDGLIDEYQHERDTTKIFKDARGQVREDAVTVDPVFEEMSRDTQLLQDGFVTFGELMQMDPDFDWDSIPVYFNEKGMRKSVRGDYRPWDGMENVDVATTMLVNALPMYLINHQLASISFTASNRDSMGEMVVVPDNAFPIAEGPDLREIVPIFCQRLETEILLDMLPWPDCPVDMTVETSIAGETYVKISLDNDNYEEYVFPTFCDSVVSPIVTESAEHMDNMASTISQIAENIGSGLNYDNDRDDGKSRIITDLRANPITSGKRRSY